MASFLNALPPRLIAPSPRCGPNWFDRPNVIDEKMEARGLILKFTRVVSVRAGLGAWADDRLRYGPLYFPVS